MAEGYGRVPLSSFILARAPGSPTVRWPFARVRWSTGTQACAIHQTEDAKFHRPSLRFAACRERGRDGLSASERVKLPSLILLRDRRRDFPREGPRVRIRFPPAASQERTLLISARR